MIVEDSNQFASEIEQSRHELNGLYVIGNNIRSEQLLSKSQELDLLILKYMKFQKDH